MSITEACTILRKHDYQIEVNQFAANYYVLKPPVGGQKVLSESGVIGEAERFVYDIRPLDDKEQRDLVALVQGFLKLKNASDLRLHLYADTGGGLTDTSGETIHDEKLIAHWTDVSEGVATIQAMLEEEKEQPL